MIAYTLCTVTIGPEEKKSFTDSEKATEGMPHISEVHLTNGLRQEETGYVAVCSLSASWSYDRENMELVDISFEVNQVCESPMV